jgi:hypothetical protein
MASDSWNARKEICKFKIFDVVSATYNYIQMDKENDLLDIVSWFLSNVTEKLDLQSLNDISKSQILEKVVFYTLYS